VTIFRQKTSKCRRAGRSGTNIVTSKYFHGKPGRHSRRIGAQLISRVWNTIVRWGEECGYFADMPSRDAFRDD